MMDFKNEAKNLVAESRLSAALKVLSDHAPASHQNSIMAQKAFLAEIRQNQFATGTDITIELSQLSWRILEFIDTINVKAPEDTPPKKPSNHRLLQRHLAATELLEEWREKREVAENPAESRRCEREISRLKKIILSYEQEIQ